MNDERPDFVGDAAPGVPPVFPHVLFLFLLLPRAPLFYSLPISRI